MVDYPPRKLPRCPAAGDEEDELVRGNDGELARLLRRGGRERRGEDDARFDLLGEASSAGDARRRHG